MQRILLMGYFGAGNFGDDALLLDWLQANQSWLAEHDLICDVLSHGPQPLASFSEGDALARSLGRCLGRREALSLPLAEYAALVAPGGSLLQDTTSWRSLAYYLALIRRFVKASKPVYLLHQGLGPITSLLGRWLAPGLLSRCAMLSVRDEQSLRWAEGQRGIARHTKLLLSADPILAASFKACVAALPSGPYCLIIPKSTGDLPHPGDKTSEAQAIAEVCTELAQCGLRPLLLALHPAQDAQLCQDVVQLNPQVEQVQLQEPAGNHIWSLLGGAELVVSYRLHGVVAAAAQGVPAFGVAYDPKVSALCEQLGLEWCFPAEVHEAETLGYLRMLALAPQALRVKLSGALDAARGRVRASRNCFVETWNNGRGQVPVH